MWWCQLIDLLKFETRPSSPLKFGRANRKRIWVWRYKNKNCPISKRQPEYQKWCALAVCVPDYGSCFSVIATIPTEEGGAFWFIPVIITTIFLIVAIWVHKYWASVCGHPYCPALTNTLCYCFCEPPFSFPMFCQNLGFVFKFLKEWKRLGPLMEHTDFTKYDRISSAFSPWPVFSARNAGKPAGFLHHFSTRFITEVVKIRLKKFCVYVFVVNEHHPPHNPSDRIIA